MPPESAEDVRLSFAALSPRWTVNLGTRVFSSWVHQSNTSWPSDATWHTSRCPADNIIQDSTDETGHTAVQRQTAVTAHLKSKQLLVFVFA